MPSGSSVIKVSILGDWKDLQKALSDSQSGADKWAGGMSKAGTAMTVGMTAPIVAGAALAVDAAAEEQAQMQKLADTIEKRIPGATDAMVASNEDWVSGLQSNIAVADSEIRSMEQSFIAAGASVEEAQHLTELAYDTAAQTGKDANTVAGAFVKGINGQVGALGRLGVETKDANGETKSFLDIQADLEQKMGGSAAAAVDNAAGRTEKMKLKFADLSEELGMVLLPMLDSVVGALSKVLDWFSNLSPAMKKVIVVLAGVAAAIGPVLIVGAKLVKGFKTIMTTFKALKVLMMANPWMLLIAAVIALVTIIILNWDKIKAFLKKTWDWLKQTAGAVWNWLKEKVGAVVSFLVDLFKKWTLVGIIASHWDKIKDGVTAVKDWIVDTWNGIIDFFKGVPDKVGSALSGLWDGLSSGFKSAINWVIDKWNAFKLEVRIPSNFLTNSLGIAGKGFSIETPNIPRLHSGGVFRSPPGTNEGLALLRDRERVLPPGQGIGGNITIVVNTGIGDPNAISRAVVEALQRYQRHNGGIPIRATG